MNPFKKLINKVLGRAMCPHCDVVLGVNAYALVCPGCHKQILRNRPCTDYIKVNKPTASALAFRRITWSTLNFLVFSALSLWIAFRRVSNVISRRLRPQPVYLRSPK